MNPPSVERSLVNQAATAGTSLIFSCHTAELWVTLWAMLAGPIVFEPIFKERIWGGRRLEGLFGKKLPPEQKIGESWEIVDRAEAQSVVASGPLAGATLHELWTNHREEIFG